MTDERFTLYDGLDIKDNVTGEIIPPCLDKGLERLIDLLNELDEKYVDEFNLRETLQLELQRVEEENEQLRKELGAFKPVMFQDMRKGTVILYSKEEVGE